MIEPLNIATSKKEWFFFYFIFFILFSFNTSYQYAKYKDFVEEEIYKDNFVVKNIYHKQDYTILKLVNKDFQYFTSISNDLNISQLDIVSSYLHTNNISFFDYLKGFYSSSFAVEKENIIYPQKQVSALIEAQHHNSNIASIYKALYLAIPLNNTLQLQNASFGISHLFAISGFHLGILLGVLFFILQALYTPFHKKYFPYRNKKYDILLISGIIIFFYLLYIDMVPSFLRSFVMFILGVYFIRNHLKIFSFNTLLITLSLIIALFPKLLFSLSLWFSIIGVFYIFLFLYYFKQYNKYMLFIGFNFFIFLAMNPFVHYFFHATTSEQLLSPLFTLFFTLLYPLSIVLHLLHLGDLLDWILEIYIHYKALSYDIATPLWFFIFYIFLSIGSIWSRTLFFIFLSSLIGFNIILYF